MEITKQQIAYIDNHLKKMGIKYWDLRTEMIDHLVSDIEQNFTSKDFKTEFSLALKRAKWNGSLSGVNTEGWQNVNRKYRSAYHKGFINFFKSFKNVCFLILSLIIFYLISENVSLEVFNKISLALFVLPLFFAVAEFIKSFFKKYGRSVNLDYGVTYMTMSFLILNAVSIFFDDKTEFTQKTLWFIILPIHYIAFNSGYNLYKKAVVKIEVMKKELSC